MIRGNFRGDPWQGKMTLRRGHVRYGKEEKPM